MRGNNVSGNYEIDFLSNGFKIRTNYGELMQVVQVIIISTVHGQKHQHLTCMVDSPTQDNINN